MKRSMTNLMLTAMLLSGAVMAQDDGGDPGRGVARISLMNGDVSVKRGDSGDVVAAAINAPLLVDDRVMTGPGARAEVQFDYYHRIRLAGDSEIRLSQLDEKQYQIQVARGLVTFSALKGGDAQVEVSTPAASLRPVAHGEYRISVMPDGSAEMTVRSGEAEIYSPSGTQKLRPGRTMMVRLGEGNQAEFQLAAAIPKDDWDEFNKNRDKELRKGSEVYQYVSRDIYGAEDLYGHGDWTYVAPYGWSWSPYVAAGWSPYRYGRWMWEDWYGWTWVSYDPWGWAPYHYGRWFYSGSRWCWYPGGMGMRHYWSPALVGWVGWNSYGGFSGGIGIGWGAVGWVPLAPFEPMHRWWGRGYYGGYRGGGFNNTTIVNNVNITNVYRNARVNNGVMAVNGTDFSRGYTGRPLRMGGEELQRANMAQGMLPVAPTRDSLRASDRAVTYRGAETRGGNERFFSRGGTTARVDRVPFDQQRSALERVATRGVTEGRSAMQPRITGDAGRGAVDTGRGAAGSISRSAEDFRGTESRGWRRADEPARGVESRQGGSDWGRFGDPSMGTRNELNQGRTRMGGDSTTGRSAEGTDRGGWRSFGSPSGSATGRSESPRMQSPRMDSTPRTEAAPRWSTGAGRSESPRMETPRMDSTPRTGGSPQWSTGGGRSESPRMETPRTQTPRMETPRMETPRSDPSRSTGGGGRQASPGGRRGNDVAEPMARGAWSTGGGSSFNDGSSRSGESRSGFSGMQSSPSWSAGGGTRMETPRSAPSYGGGSSMRSMPSYGGGSMRSAPSYGGGSSMRSMPSYGGGSMRSAPSFGGGGSSMRSAPSFGGGGGGMRSGGSFGGGGGMRSGGSFGGGGGMRSGGGGGGGMRGGGRGR